MTPPTPPRPPLLAARPGVVLVVVTLIWGMSFPWTHSWQKAAAGCPGGELLSSLTLIGVRMPLAILVLGLWQPRLILRPTRREHLGGAALGAVFFAGFLLQTWGLAFTRPALSAFFTSLCSAWVPLAALVLFRERVAPLTLAGLSVGLVGCAVLVEGGWALGPGEWLTLAASVLFTGQVLLLERLGRHLNSAHLSAAFLGITGLLALLGGVMAAGAQGVLGGWVGWTAEMLGRGEVLRTVLLLVVFPTVLGFHWMNTYQPLVPASRAALIYLLEPVFSSVFSVWWGYDEVTVPLLVGGGLILGGNVLVELPRLWGRGGANQPIDPGLPDGSVTAPADAPAPPSLPASPAPPGPRG